MLGRTGLDYLLNNYKFSTVLDIGSGLGEQVGVMRSAGKKVTEVDLRSGQNYMDIRFGEFDAIWICHVLEHQPNPNMFLQKVHSDLKDGGVLAITVPPLKNSIVGGHVSLWNAGILLYNLVLAGFDCSLVYIKKYGYNITVILEKKTINLPRLTYDFGDINRLSGYFPKGLSEGFNGDIAELNWLQEVSL